MQERDELMCWLATVGATADVVENCKYKWRGIDGFEAALVGSRLSSGDKIATAPQLVCDASKKEGMTIPGLLTGICATQSLRRGIGSCVRQQYAKATQRLQAASHRWFIDNSRR